MYVQVGSTPTITIVSDDVLFSVDHAEVIIQQKNLKLIKDSKDQNSGIDVFPLFDSEGYQTGTEIDIDLSQEETLRFRPGEAHIQVVWYAEDGNVLPSDVAWLAFEDSLIKGGR